LSAITRGVGGAYIGTWFPEIVQELATIVRPMTSQQGGTAAGISWVDVAARMGATVLLSQSSSNTVTVGN
jgi:hypothetical protein